MILRLVTNQKQTSTLRERERGLIILNESIEFFCLNPDVALICLTSSAFVVFVQSQDKKSEHAITGSLLQALEKHHNTEHEVSTHTEDYRFQRYLFCKILRNSFFYVAPDRCSCPHGNCGPSHRGDRDHGGLAELDRGLPAAQTRGLGIFVFIEHNLDVLSSQSLSALFFFFVPPRCRPECMRSCAQC